MSNYILLAFTVISGALGTWLVAIWEHAGNGKQNANNSSNKWRRLTTLTAGCLLIAASIFLPAISSHKDTEALRQDAANTQSGLIKAAEALYSLMGILTNINSLDTSVRSEIQTERLKYELFRTDFSELSSAAAEWKALQISHQRKTETERLAYVMSYTNLYDKYLANVDHTIRLYESLLISLINTNNISVYSTYSAPPSPEALLRLFARTGSRLEHKLCTITTSTNIDWRAECKLVINPLDLANTVNVAELIIQCYSGSKQSWYTLRLNESNASIELNDGNEAPIVRAYSYDELKSTLKDSVKLFIGSQADFLAPTRQ